MEMIISMRVRFFTALLVPDKISDDKILLLIFWMIFAGLYNLFLKVVLHNSLKKPDVGSSFSERFDKCVIEVSGFPSSAA